MKAIYSEFTIGTMNVAFLAPAYISINTTLERIDIL